NTGGKRLARAAFVFQATQQHDLTGRGGLPNLVDGAEGVSLGLQIQDEHVGSVLGAEQISSPSRVGVHDHRDGRAALENFLQAQPHETLTAKNRNRKRWHRGAGHTASWFKTEDSLLLKLFP